MKTAVLFTGQVRGTDYFLENLGNMSYLNPVGFVSTWKRQGIKAGGWLGKAQLSRVLGPEIASEIPEGLVENSMLTNLLHGFFSEIAASTGSFVPSFRESELIPLCDIEDDMMFHPMHIDCRDTDSARIYYKIRRCVNYILNYEKAANIEFTHFLRLRPDCLVKHPPYIETPEPDEVVVDFIMDSPNGRLIGDNLIFCSKKVFLQLIRHWHKLLCENEVSGIHSILDRCFADLSLNPVHHPITINDYMWPLDRLAYHLSQQRTKSPEIDAFCVYLDHYIDNHVK